MKKLNINRFFFNGFVGKITLLSSAIALTSVVLYSCSKEQISTGYTEQTFFNELKKNEELFQFHKDVNNQLYLSNKGFSNPYSQGGQTHNDCLDSILNANSTLENLFATFNHTLGFTLDEMTTLLQQSEGKLFTKERQYLTQFLYERLWKSVPKDEYYLLQSFYINVTNTGLDQVEPVIQSYEVFINSNLSLNAAAKARLLRVAALYRSSRQFWTDHSGGDPAVFLTEGFWDSVGEYIAQNGGGGAVEDGKDVYRFAALFSAVMSFLGMTSSF